MTAVSTTSWVSGPGRERTLDLRLAPAAIAVWGTTLVGIHSGPGMLAAYAAVASLAGVLVATIGPKRWRTIGITVFALVAIAAAGLGIRAHHSEQHPLHEVAERGGAATVRVELSDRPRQLSDPSYGNRRPGLTSLVRADLLSLSNGARDVRLGGEVLLLAPTEYWGSLTIGHRAMATAKVLPPRSGDTLVAVLRASGAPRELSEPTPVPRVAEGLRHGLRKASVAILGDRAAGLLPGLVVGDTSLIPVDVVEEFRTAGLAHLTAVSGANLAIVSGAVLLLLRGIGAGPVLAAVGAGLALAGFVVLAGPEPSVQRAAAMGAIALYALAAGRPRAALPALSAAVIGLLLWEPELATSAGFALSAAATAGLVVLAPPWAAALHRRGVPIGLAEALAVPTAAHLVTAPIVAAISGEVSAVAIIANLLAGPVVAPATVFGVLATVVAPVWEGGAQLLVVLAMPEVQWLLGVASAAASVPGASWAWPSGVEGGLALAGVVLVGLVMLRWPRLRWTAATLALVTVVVVVPVRTFAPGWPPAGWSVVACDVGQGDGLVLATGTPGEAVVVDTGPDPEPMGDCLQRLGVESVPLVVLTHLHADHMGGLTGVFEHATVAAVGVGPLREPGWAMAEVHREVESTGARVLDLTAEHRMRWNALTLDVIGPVGALARTSDEEEANDASIVLMATTPAGRVLLTGDVELPAQSSLLSSTVDLRADVLKVPHHGSRSTSPDFLDAVDARIGLVSVGDDNSYGHPSPVVTGALARSGSRVLRTDQEGDIAILPGPRHVSRGDPMRAED